MAAEAQRATCSREQSPFAAVQPGIAVRALLAQLHTEHLETIAAAAIELLDDRAGDCDIEDDDPAGDALDEQGEHPTDDGTSLLLTRPIYGIDQTRGPLNETDAYQVHQASIYGLVRNARGNWAFAA